MLARLPLILICCYLFTGNIEGGQSQEKTSPNPAPTKKKGFFKRLEQGIESLSENPDDKAKAGSQPKAAGSPQAPVPSSEPNSRSSGLAPSLRKGMSARVPIDLGAPIQPLQPESCLSVTGQWDCVREILKAAATRRPIGVRTLGDEQWDGRLLSDYSQEYLKKFRDNCGETVGVWRSQHRPGFATGYIEMSRCMLEYRVDFTPKGSFREFRMGLDWPRFDVLYESPEDQAAMKATVQDAIQILMLAHKGDVAEVQQTMAAKGFVKPSAEAVVKIARIGETGFGKGLEDINGSSLGEMQSCGMGHGSKNAANKGVYGVEVTCIFEDWFRRFSVSCSKPGSCEFSGVKQPR